MKKKYYIAAVVVAILLIAGVAVGIEAYDRKKTQEAIDSIEQEIILMCYVTGPLGENIPTVKYGYFIDKYGNKCYFDVEEQYYRENMDVYEYLAEHIKEYEKIPFLKEKQVCKIYQYLNSIDNNAEIVREYSERNLEDFWYCWAIRMSGNGNIECIFLEKGGGEVIYKADENAEKIMKIIGKDTWRDEEELWNRCR